MTADPVTGDSPGDLDPLPNDLRDDVSEFGATVFAHEAPGEFGGHLELRLRTRASSLPPGLVSVLSKHGLGAAYLGDCKWQLVA